MSRIGSTKPYAPTTLAGVAASTTVMPRMSAADIAITQAVRLIGRLILRRPWPRRAQDRGELTGARVLEQLFECERRPPRPVGMLVDRAGQIGLRALAQHVFQVREHHRGRRPREIRMDAEPDGARQRRVLQPTLGRPR